MGQIAAIALLVVTSLAALSTLVSVEPFRRVYIFRVRANEANISGLRAALEIFRRDVGRYPSTAEGLDWQPC